MEGGIRRAVAVLSANLMKVNRQEVRDREPSSIMKMYEWQVVAMVTRAGL